jgi:hypothetical protein
MGETRFAFVAHAGFGQIEIICQVPQFLAQRGSMAFSFRNFDFAPDKDFIQKKSHRLLPSEAVQRAGALEFTLQSSHQVLRPGRRRRLLF